MLHGESLGLLVGAIALGGVHGIEPGHGWPVAATYALDRSNKWLYGFAASFIIGVGHLISSIAMVAVFFSAKAYFDLTQVNEPIQVAGGIHIGGPVSLVAGVLLIALGVREYRHGHSHGHGEDEHAYGDDHDGDEHAHGDDHSHDGDGGTRGGDSADAHAHDHTANDHAHDEHAHEDDGHDYHVPNGGHVYGEGNHDHSHDGGHSHDHANEDGHPHGHSHDDHSHVKNADESDGLLARLAGVLPFVGGHSHAHGMDEETANRGLLGIAWFAFVLGFAHEEEFEIIALCAGSTHCLELMLAYALAVIVGIVGLTMLLIAGYQRYEERVERYTPYLPAFSAAVLIIMGLGFVSGLL